MAEVNTIDVAGLSLPELLALAKQVNEVKKDLVTADAQRLAAMLTEFTTTVVGERDSETSEKSGWHGIKVYGLPVTIDGTEFSVSVTLTDVKASEANKAALKVAAEAAGTPAPEADAEGDNETDDDAEPEAPAPEPEPVKAGSRKK